MNIHICLFRIYVVVYWLFCWYNYEVCQEVNCVSIVWDFKVDDVLDTKLDRQFQLVMDKGTLDAIGLHPDGPIKR